MAKNTALTIDGFFFPLGAAFVLLGAVLWAQDSPGATVAMAVGFVWVALGLSRQRRQTNAAADDAGPADSPSA